MNCVILNHFIQTVLRISPLLDKLTDKRRKTSYRAPVLDIRQDELAGGAESKTKDVDNIVSSPIVLGTN